MQTAFVKTKQSRASIYKLNAQEFGATKNVVTELENFLSDWEIYPDPNEDLIIKIKTVMGSKIKFTVKFDEWPDNPFRNCDMLGKIVTTKRCKYFHDCKEERLDSFDDIIEKYFNDKYYYFPLEIYDHSGVSVTLCLAPPTSTWDSGVQGYYIADKNYVHNECGVAEDKDEVFRQMALEIKELNDYWNESQYMVKYKASKELGEDYYSCTGFQGSTQEYILEQLIYVLKELGEIE